MLCRAWTVSASGHGSLFLALSLQCVRLELFIFCRLCRISKRTTTANVGQCMRFVICYLFGSSTYLSKLGPCCVRCSSSSLLQVAFLLFSACTHHGFLDPRSVVNVRRNGMCVCVHVKLYHASFSRSVCYWWPQLSRLILFKKCIF
jgi:hypothetical protein